MHATFILQKLSAKELIKLNFHKNGDGNYQLQI